MRRSSIVRILLLFLAASGLGAADGAAQPDEGHAVLVATLVEVDSVLRRVSDARIRGPIAFAPRVVRSPRGPAPRGWPDSLTLTWVGHRHDAVRVPGEVATILADANGSRGPVRWLACGEEPGARRCWLSEFSAVVSAGEPWIRGDVAEVMVSVAHHSTIRLHPWAWYAAVLRFQRRNGRWEATHWHSSAQT